MRINSKYDQLLETMRNTKVPKTAIELSERAGIPISSVYRQLRDLTSIDVVIIGKQSMLNDKGRAVTVSTYLLDPERFKNYEESLSVLGVIPQLFNQVSRRLYSLLDLVERYNPSGKTAGARAADSYLDVATSLLWLSFQEPTVDTMREQVRLREYLQQALPVVNNVASQIEQMLIDKRLWTEDLYALSANSDITASHDLIKNRYESINLPE